MKNAIIAILVTILFMLLWDFFWPYQYPPKTRGVKDEVVRIRIDPILIFKKELDGKRNSSAFNDQ